MKILRHAGSPTQTAIAIGSFDGVHLGHQAMLARVVQAARQRGISAAALTFEPLPREYFTPATAPARLSSLAEKLAAIAGTGVQCAFVQRFAGPFAALTAQEFERRLAGHYRARWLMV
ncbi:MAG TPA: bifunctional riboflavin kinase/FAD synthetase, partial [Usitatibacter sp.]